MLVILFLLGPIFGGMFAGVLIRSIEDRSTQNKRLATLFAAVIFLMASIVLQLKFWKWAADHPLNPAVVDQL